MRLLALLRRRPSQPERASPFAPTYDMLRPLHGEAPETYAWPEHPLVLDRSLRVRALEREATVIRADAEVIRADSDVVDADGARAALLRRRELAEQGHVEDLATARTSARYDAELLELGHRAERRALIRDLDPPTIPIRLPVPSQQAVPPSQRDEARDSAPAAGPKAGDDELARRLLAQLAGAPVPGIGAVAAELGIGKTAAGRVKPVAEAMRAASRAAVPGREAVPPT